MLAGLRLGLALQVVLWGYPGRSGVVAANLMGAEAAIVLGRKIRGFG